MSNTILAIGNLSTSELLIILAIVVLVFGVGKIPEIGRQMGQGIKNFKKEMTEAKDAIAIEDKAQDQTTLTREVKDQKDNA